MTIAGYIIAVLIGLLLLLAGAGVIYIKAKDREAERKVREAKEEAKRRQKENAERENEAKENKAGAVAGSLESNNDFIAHRLQNLAEKHRD